MNKQKYILIIFFILILPARDVFAQNTKTINVVTTAVPFLRISPDARASGMGGVGIAISPDANASFWNIGKIPFIDSRGGIIANYSPWLREWANDMYLASLAGYYHLNEEQSIHGSVTYFNPGDLQFSDYNGNHLQSYHPKEFGIDLGYSRKLSDKLGVGLGLKYIYSNLADEGAGEDYKTGNAIAADLGIYYDNKKTNGDGWSFGAALANLGSKISYISGASQKDFIPANLGLGASYSKVLNEQNKVIIGLDVNKLLVPTAPGDSTQLAAYRNKSVVGSWFSSFGDAPGGFREELREFQVSVGVEYWYNNQFALRAGYFFEDKTKGDRKYFSAGASVKYDMLTFNFSYLAPSGNGTDRNPLSNSLQFGLLFDLKK
jgi:Type IX secretion system protein PorV